MKSLTITLPMPHKNLSPNARGHWSKKSSQARLQRSLAAIRVREALGRRRPPKWLAAEVLIEVIPPDRRKRDKDNIQGSLKSAFDGAEDAGVVENDNVFTYLPVQILEPDKNNAGVRITFTSK
jgi:crossover junction endodeoxyribonuclease RusA